MNKKILITILVFALIPTTALAAPPKPTQAQIDAAKKPATIVISTSPRKPSIYKNLPMPL